MQHARDLDSRSLSLKQWVPLPSARSCSQHTGRGSLTEAAAHRLEAGTLVAALQRDLGAERGQARTSSLHLICCILLQVILTLLLTSRVTLGELPNLSEHGFPAQLNEDGNTWPGWVAQPVPVLSQCTKAVGSVPLVYAGQIQESTHE